MDNRTNELPVTADPAEAEKNEAAAGLGKFKDVKALMDAYVALEAEFTRRSQRLKELEANKAVTPAQAASGDALSQQADGGETVGEQPAENPLSDEVKNAVIEEYLHGVRANRGVPFVTGGGAVTAQRRTPATVKEAGRLAKQFFDKKEN